MLADFAKIISTLDKCMGRLYWRISGYESAGRYRIEAAGYDAAFRQMEPRPSYIKRTVTLLDVPAAQWVGEGGVEIPVELWAWEKAAEALDSVALAAGELQLFDVSLERLVLLLADVADLIQGGPFPEHPGGRDGQAAPLQLEEDPQGS